MSPAGATKLSPQDLVGKILMIAGSALWFVAFFVPW
jgi:hypothetical protein